MKNIVVLALILVTGGLAYMGNQIATLNSQIATLTDIKAALTAKNRKLTDKNKKLVAQRNATKKAITNNRKRVAKRSLSRASKKIAKASGAMIPFAGITVIAAATADDIRDLCTDVEEAQNLEKLVLDKEPPVSAPQRKYCYDNIGEEIAEIAENARNAISANFSITYEELWRQGAELSKQLNETTEAIINAPYQEEFEHQYKNIIKYWSEMMEGLIDDPKPASSKEPQTFETAGKYWGRNHFELVHEEY